MLGYCIFITILFIFVFVGLIFSIKYNIQAGKALIKYDDFYQSTLEQIDESGEFINDLAKKDVYSMDPDIQNLRRIIVTTRDILAGYKNAIQKKGKPTE